MFILIYNLSTYLSIFLFCHTLEATRRHTRAVHEGLGERSPAGVPQHRPRSRHTAPSGRRRTLVERYGEKFSPQVFLKPKQPRERVCKIRYFFPIPSPVWQEAAHLGCHIATGATVGTV